MREKIEVIGQSLLLDASSDGEALLLSLLEKVKSVEATAMATLAERLSVKEFKQLQKRIGKLHSASQSRCMASSFRARIAPRVGLSTKECYPKISFHLRGKSAGTAHLQRWELRFNPILLAENGQAFIDEVVPHEYAHLLVYALFGDVSPHGPEWRMMMEEILEVSAHRTHQFSTENSRTREYRKFSYRCQCQTHQLSTIRHNRLLRGEAQYHCKKCGSPLEFIE
nr:SprT family zinc-dependent metalloprotease [Ignatzschineria cameli]